MDVLITGGLGYAGSILIKKLLDNGHSVTVIDNKRFGDDHINEFEGGLDIIEKDVRDVESYKEDLDRADVVVHLAALSKEPTSLYNTKYCIDTNYLSTKKLVDYLKGKDKKFIYASSTSVYFTYDIVKEPEEYKEDKELNPISPYSITKYASEQAIRENLDNYIIFRPGTHYGISPRMRLDLVVNAMVKSIYQNGKIWYLEGIYRPLVDVETVTDAYLAGVEGSETGIFNIVDFNTSLKELAENIQKALPVESKLIGKEVDVERNYKADGSNLRETFDIKPRCNIVGEKIKKLWNWCQNNDTTKDKYYNAKM